MLALDGGGICGLITLGILRELEKKLADRTGQGDAFRLGKWFDYIGGTSTGAIVAAGLARGMSVTELIDFYRDSGKEMFEKTSLLKRLASFYEADPLREKLQQVFAASSTLEAQFLESLLLVVTHNITTDSPWPVSSNPDARYNDMARKDSNLRIPLWQLVRASTAAPVRHDLPLRCGGVRRQGLDAGPTQISYRGPRPRVPVCGLQCRPEPRRPGPDGVPKCMS